MDTCKSCDRARRALCATASPGDIIVKGLIACSYWSCYQESGSTQDENGDEVLFRNHPFDYAYSIEGPIGKTYFRGWADLGGLPDSEKGSGIHTNSCVLIHETNYCSHYVKRRDLK
jgi:hypothetical protein